MSSNLVINVRCTCEEEFLLLHKLHKLYQEDQLRKRLKDRLVNVLDEKPLAEKEGITLTDVLEAEALEHVERLEA